MRPKRRILLDLDCTLADFIGGVAALWGFKTAELLQHWTPGEYPCNSALTRATNRSEVVGDVAFWDRIGDAPGFWAELPVLPWAQDLFNRVTAATPDWWIVTSPSKCPRCIPEKKQWLNRHFGAKAADRMVPTKHKHLLAQRNVALIDDYDANLSNFSKAGGFVVPVPARHNQWHAHESDPMAITLPTLESFLRTTA